MNSLPPMVVVFGCLVSDNVFSLVGVVNVVYGGFLNCDLLMFFSTVEKIP